MTRWRSKYGAKLTIIDGIRFASKREAARYRELTLLQRSGAIHNLELQPHYPINVAGQKICTYIADFRYIGACGSLIVEDVKGVETPVFKLKRKLFEVIYGMKLTVTK